MYYDNKLEILKDIFGSSEISLGENHLSVNGRVYPIVDDVIVLLDSSQYPDVLRCKVKTVDEEEKEVPSCFAEDIQFTFGEEWQKFPEILPEHEREFLQYFDLVDLSSLSEYRVCDLGCGIGRWSYFLKEKCREIVLIDFSEAIFVARRNLKDIDNAVFFMADLKRLPFRDNFSDFLFCLGVLHHLPTNALEEVRNLKRYAPRMLIYLYYALDNRAFYFRFLLGMATVLRSTVSRVRNPLFRKCFTWFATGFMYLPWICLGRVLRPLGLSKYVPLYEGYSGKSWNRICQDAYDRFFTRIEQRFSKKQIMELKDSFGYISVSDQMPYWHFVCERERLRS